MSYRFLSKTFTYAQLGKPFTIAEGRVVGVVQSTIEQDLSMTVVFCVEEN